MKKHLAAPDPASRSLSELLADWADAGLITSEQAEAIREREAGNVRRPIELEMTPAPAAGPSLVVEALAYLGGVVMLVGATILVSVFWKDIPTAVRLLLIGGTAIALIGGGFAIPDRLGDAADRLRSVLWAIGVATSAGFFAVFSLDVLGRHDYHSMVVIGPAAAVVAAALWWLRPTWLQQAALFVPLMVAVEGLGLELNSGDSRMGGALMWGAGIVWTTAALVRWLEPRTTGVAFGVLGAVLGSLIMDSDLGVGVGLLTAAAMITLALREHSLPWLGVSAIALLATAPQAANRWFPGRLSAALTFIVAGGVLVGAAVWVTRHRPRI